VKDHPNHVGSFYIILVSHPSVVIKIIRWIWGKILFF